MKKSSIGLQVIIIAALGVVILVVLIALISSHSGKMNKSIATQQNITNKCYAVGGKCYDVQCPSGTVEYPRGDKYCVIDKSTVSEEGGVIGATSSSKVKCCY